MQDNIKHLTPDAARLLLTWVYTAPADDAFYNTVSQRDIAGFLTVEQYQDAFAQLVELGFVEREEQSFRVFVGYGGMLHA